MEEERAEVSDSTVGHYVCKLKWELGIGKEFFLGLVRAFGEVQSDFGEADFYVMGAKRHLSYFVLAFLLSSVGLTQAFPRENAECACRALKNIFEFIGGSPVRIVFDSAPDVGSRMGGKIRATGFFGSFAAHCGFAFSFCNPNAGHEKGSVGNRAGFIRRNLSVLCPPSTWADDSTEACSSAAWPFLREAIGQRTGNCDVGNVADSVGNASQYHGAKLGYLEGIHALANVLEWRLSCWPFKSFAMVMFPVFHLSRCWQLRQRSECLRSQEVECSPQKKMHQSKKRDAR